MYTAINKHLFFIEQELFSVMYTVQYKRENTKLATFYTKQFAVEYTRTTINENLITLINGHPFLFIFTVHCTIVQASS